MWKRPDGSLIARVYFWTPGDTIDERGRGDNVPYAAWRDAGHLFAPPGRMIDKTFVAQFVQQQADAQDIRALAFDQALIVDFERECNNLGFDVWTDDRKRDAEGNTSEPEGAGLRMVRHGQGFLGAASQTVLWMPRSINALEDAIINSRLDIIPSPLLRWNIASATVETDPMANRRWTKAKSTGRIDGVVALAMAVGLATASEPTSVTSIWDRDDLW